MSVRVAIVDDDAPYRGAIADLLSLESAFEVVASFGEPRALLAAAEKVPPPGWDLVLMDIEMPGLDGLVTTAAMKTVAPNSAVVTLSLHDDVASREKALAAGASAFVGKQAAEEALLTAIRGAAPSPAHSVA